MQFKVGFDDTFETNNYILFIVSKVNWMIRNFITKEANVVLEIYKTQVRLYIEYFKLAWDTVSNQ